MSADLVTPILQILMISLRAGSLWMFFPIFGNARIPHMVRLSGALTLSTALLPMAGPQLPKWSLTHAPALYDLVSFVAREFLLGAGMGLAARWIFSTVQASAHWVGMQMGFSAGGHLDPEYQ